MLPWRDHMSSWPGTVVDVGLSRRRGTAGSCRNKSRVWAEPNCRQVGAAAKNARSNSLFNGKQAMHSDQIKGGIGLGAGLTPGDQGQIVVRLLSQSRNQSGDNNV